MGRPKTVFDPTSILAYLAKNIAEPNARGCKLWTGSTRGNPKFAYNQYAVAWIDYKRYSAHRLQWEILKGPIAEGMKICHHCDQPLCMNIEHHFEGTPKENTQDMIRKGRAHGCVALVERNKKLSDAQVEEIRIRRQKGETLTSIASSFSVGISQVHRIVHNASRAPTQRKEG